MADSLKIINDALIICNYGLATTCCSPTGKYWDGVSCDDEMYVNRYCNKISRCNFNDRVFFGSNSYCDNEIKIPECQRILVDLLTSMHSGVYDSGNQISYFGAGSATITWSDTNITLNDPTNGITVIANSGSLGLVNTAIGAIPNWSASNTNISFTSIGTIIAATSYIFSSAGSDYLPTKPSSLDFTHGTNTTKVTVLVDVDPFVLGNRIHSKIIQLPTVTGEVFVHYNTEYLDDKIHAFEAVWSGVTLTAVNAAGTRKDNLHLIDHIVYTTYSDDGANDIKYGDYDLGWMQDTNYLRIGSGLYDGTSATVGNLCPLESPQFSSSGDLKGPYPIDFAGIYCCPQRGFIVGTGQNIGISSDNTLGYEYDSTTDSFDNLENTIYVNGTCYKVSPFYFLGGKNGRFLQEPITTRKLFIEPECDIGLCSQTGIILASGDLFLPEICATDLFLPQFSHELPWGPFGGYFYNIENTQHPNQLNYPTYGRIGWDYRPSGWIRTVGEWTKTNHVEIVFGYYKQVPYYVGTDTIDDRWFGCVSGLPSTGIYSTGVSLVYNSGINQYTLTVQSSGKTVGDFLNIVNNLQAIVEKPDLTHNPGCDIFSFCPAGSYINSIPLSRLINVSSELYDIAKSKNAYDVTLGSANPLTDIAPDLSYGAGGNEPLSGSDIFYPKRYSDTWPGYSSNAIVATKLSEQQPIDQPRRLFKPPPDCRHKLRNLPKESGLDGNFRQKSGQVRDQGLSSPWWQTIPGQFETIISLRKKTSYPVGVDGISAFVRDRKIWIIASSGGIAVASGNVNTNKNGFTYRDSLAIQDLNDFTLTYDGSPFLPVSAVSGTQQFPIWLDDSTWWDNTTLLPVNSGGVGAVETPINFSYREPIYDSGETNILSNNLDIKSFIRRRCIWASGDNLYDSPLNTCLPLSALKFTDGQAVSCSVENIYDGNFIVSYGCVNRNCKTQWYIKSQRCPCSSTYNCFNEQQEPHLFNQAGNNSSNTDRWSRGLDSSRYEDYHVNQPDLYLCEQNIYPSCDIPFLIKVPFQAVSSVTGSFEKMIIDANGGPSRFQPCTTNLDIYYGDGDLKEWPLFYDTLGEWDKTRAGCGESHTPILYQITDNPSHVFCGDCNGWCQYIDPSNTTKVAYEDIPRTWPPTAYIATRGNPSICPADLYKNSQSDICNVTVSQENCNWDRIVGVHPHLPYDKYINNIPCMYIDSNDSLTVLLRPIVNNFTAGDYCGDINSTRLDINCGTKCCQCFFECDTLVAYPCTQNMTLDYTVLSDSFQFCAEYIYSYPDGNPSCNYNICRVAGGGLRAEPVSLYATYRMTTTLSATYQAHTCGCKESRISGEGHTTYTTLDTFSCAVTVPPHYTTPCSSDSGICRGNCLPSDSDSLVDCTLANGINSYNNGYTDIVSSGCTFGTEACNQDILNGFTRWNWLEESSIVEIVGECGEYFKAWNYLSTNDYGGTSTCGPDGIGPFNNGCFGGIGDIYDRTLIGYSDIGTYQKNRVVCAACNGGSQNGSSLPHITGFYDSGNFVCGTSNIFRTYGSATGTYYNCRG